LGQHSWCALADLGKSRPLKTQIGGCNSPILFTQFGFENTDEWKTRRDTLIATLHSNPKARYVTRVLQFGSEPLFDSVLTPSQLADEVIDAKVKLADVGIPVTVSDMAYGFQKYLKSDKVGVMRVLTAMDSVNAHTLPFFSTKASTGGCLILFFVMFFFLSLLLSVSCTWSLSRCGVVSYSLADWPASFFFLLIGDKAWPIVKTDLDWFGKYAPGKKIYMDEVGLSILLPLLTSYITTHYLFIYPSSCRCYYLLHPPSLLPTVRYLI
jgi:hypothetical protein